MAAEDWLFEVRDETGTTVAELDNYSEIEGSIRRNYAGTWTVKCPYSEAARLLRTPGYGLVAWRNDEVEFSGPTTNPDVAWEQSVEDVQVSGVTDDALVLDDRRTVPPAGFDRDERSGNAEAVLKALVDDHCVNPTDPARVVGGLSIEPDLGRGTSVVGGSRLELLGDFLRRLAYAGGDLGFRVEQLGGSSIQFSVYESADVTDTAQFSADLNNLEAYKYGLAIGGMNVAYVGGQGEGDDRTIIERDNPDSITRWSRRIEGFIDRRDTDDPVELEQSIAEELARTSDTTTLSITTIETEAVRYGIDYHLGDVGRVILNDGTFIDDVIQEVVFKLDSEGEHILPTIGSPGATRDVVLRAADALKRTSRRVASLERR